MRSILESDKPSIIKTVLANVADEEELEAGSNTKNSIKNLMESINEAEACKLCNTTCEIVAVGKPDDIGPIKEEEDDDDDHHDHNDDEDTDIDEIDDFCGIQIRNSSNTCSNKSKTAFDNITSTTDKAVNISKIKVHPTEESESVTTTTTTTATIAATTSATISTSNKAGGSKLGYNNIIASLLRTTTL